MKKLTPKQVIELLSEKVRLKKGLRVAKKEGDSDLVSTIHLKIQQIETKLSTHKFIKN